MALSGNFFGLHRSPPSTHWALQNPPWQLASLVRRTTPHPCMECVLQVGMNAVHISSWCSKSTMPLDAGAKKAFITAPSGPLNILKVHLSALTLEALPCDVHSFKVKESMAVSAGLPSLQADWFAKHRQQRPAVAVVFLER